MEPFLLNEDHLTLSAFDALIKSERKVILGDAVVSKVNICYKYLQEKLRSNEDLIYGVNTGFGSLCNTKISESDLTRLQENLIRSHACGLGERVPDFLVKRMLLLKVIGLSKGHSGVQVETVNRLLFFYNHNIFPLVYQQGSLGASGDLAPLAHLCLPLIGEGEVVFEGKVHPSSDVNEKFNLSPIELRAKEGLALLNGTQYDGRLSPFQSNVNEIRKQKGQVEIARQFLTLLEGSTMASQPKEHVQDPYSFRCIPQVHGASLDAINYASQIFENEINAVTDNPTIFPETDEIVSAGNFHGQPLAITMDFLAIAVAELASISERRIYKLISGTRGLPPFLISNSGLNSGFMIVQYTCASIVSQNKQLCTPASVDTIDSSQGQEDHVSMGANAATKLFRVVENSISVISMEIFTAAQAFEFRQPCHSSVEVTKLFEGFREQVKFVSEDANASIAMNQSIRFVKSKLKD
ncbi:MAG: aromatic amino acid lyase [Flavobacteriia bacterium]|nr:aromatic amino acid lyase [Flavobacteriia bacterium]